jgi:hypothetical protein
MAFWHIKHIHTYQLHIAISTKIDEEKRKLNAMEVYTVPLMPNV